MATIPNNTKCSQLGCKERRSKLNSYCLAHGGLDSIQTEERKAFVSMYQTQQWKQARQLQLSKQPLCQCCLLSGKVSQAQHIDHVFPWSKINKAAFYNNILQSLCPECHSVKTGLEQRGIYRHYGQVVHDYTITDYASVVLMQQNTSVHS